MGPVGAPALVAPRTRAGIGDLLDERRFEPVFVPIARLDTMTVIGFEAGARPLGPAAETPLDDLFAEAAAIGREAELDWVCRATAYRAALDAKLHQSVSLLVKTDLRSLIASCPSDLSQTVWKAESRLRVVVEVSRRMLDADPDSVPGSMARARRIGWGLALDVDSGDRAMSVLPVVQPDVLKLSASTICTPAGAVALAEAERSDAQILVTNIDTRADLALARAAGATIGTGSLVRPGPESTPFAAAVSRPIRLLAPPDSPSRTPFDLLARTEARRPADPSALLALSRQLEGLALRTRDPALVVATFQLDRFTPQVAARYAAIASGGSVVSVLAPGMPPTPTPGVSGVELRPTDRVAAEWNVFVIGGTVAGALSARRREGRFELCLTYDRDVVAAALRPLLERIDGDGPVRTSED